MACRHSAKFEADNNNCLRLRIESTHAKGQARADDPGGGN
jgi:hypothetical protein